MKVLTEEDMTNSLEFQTNEVSARDTVQSAMKPLKLGGSDGKHTTQTMMMNRKDEISAKRGYV